MHSRYTNISWDPPLNGDRCTITPPLARLDRSCRKRQSVPGGRRGGHSHASPLPGPGLCRRRCFTALTFAPAVQRSRWSAWRTSTHLDCWRGGARWCELVFQHPIQRRRRLPSAAGVRACSLLCHRSRQGRAEVEALGRHGSPLAGCPSGRLVAGAQPLAVLRRLGRRVLGLHRAWPTGAAVSGPRR